jgi:hypothetical protein
MGDFTRPERSVPGIFLPIGVRRRLDADRSIPFVPFVTPQETLLGATPQGAVSSVRAQQSGRLRLLAHSARCGPRQLRNVTPPVRPRSSQWLSGLSLTTSARHFPTDPLGHHVVHFAT